MSMKTFSLTNLRELTTEEQMRLNGGYGSPCDSGCSCLCGCSCECDTKNPDASTGQSFQKEKNHSMYANVGKTVMRRRTEEIGY